MNLLEFPFDLLFYVISLLNNLKDIKNFTTTCHFLHKLKQRNEVKLIIDNIITTINRNKISKVLHKKKIIQQFPWRLNFPMKGEQPFKVVKIGTPYFNFSNVHNYDFVHYLDVTIINENLEFEIDIQKFGDSIVWIKFSQSVDNVYFCSRQFYNSASINNNVTWKIHLSSMIEKNTKFSLGKFFEESIEFPICFCQKFYISGKFRNEAKEECLGKIENQLNFRMKICSRIYDTIAKNKIVNQDYNEYTFSNGQKAYSDCYNLILKK